MQISFQLHQTRNGAVLRRGRGVRVRGETKMAGPKTEDGVQEVRRPRSGTQTAGSRYYEGRARYYGSARGELDGY